MQRNAAQQLIITGQRAVILRAEALIGKQLQHFHDLRRQGQRRTGRMSCFQRVIQILDMQIKDR